MTPGARALFLDFGGTLTRLRDNRTVVDEAGHPVLMPNVAETLARVRPGFDACFIVSNQGRIARGEITEAEVRRRFAWVNERLGRPFTDFIHPPRPGMFLGLAARYGIDLAASTHVGDSDKDREAAAAAGIAAFIPARDFFGWPTDGGYSGTGP